MSDKDRESGESVHLAAEDEQAAERGSIESEQGLLEEAVNPERLIEVQKELEELIADCKSNKGVHYAAATRKTETHRGISLVLATVNVLLASQFLKLADSNATFLQPLVALLAGVLAAWLAVLDVQKGSEGHHRVANRYLALRRRARLLKARCGDGSISPRKYVQLVARYLDLYQKINDEAVAFRTEQVDRDIARREAVAYSAAKRNEFIATKRFTLSGISRTRLAYAIALFIMAACLIGAALQSVDRPQPLLLGITIASVSCAILLWVAQPVPEAQSKLEGQVGPSGSDPL